MPIFTDSNATSGDSASDMLGRLLEAFNTEHGTSGQSTNPTSGDSERDRWMKLLTAYNQTT